MNKYRILHKVATVAEIVEPFVHNDYEFTSYAPEWWNSDAWVASKIVTAENANNARVSFINGLIPIIEQCSTISQCAFRFTVGSFVIYRLNDNPDKDVFIYYVKDVGHTGLQFAEEERAQLPKMAAVENQKGFMYIMDAANCITFYSRLAMLLSAAEAFAGEVDMGNTKTTNKTILKEILGVDLYDKLYARGVGLRHKLVHGNIADHNRYYGMTEEVYKKIRSYLKVKFDIQIEENVVSPLRNFHDNYAYTKMYYRFRNEPVFDLRLIEDELSERKQARDKNLGEIFSGYAPDVKNY